MAKNEQMEMILCAKFNFENLEKDFPVIKDHPFYKIAKMQLDEACGLDMNIGGGVNDAPLQT